MDEPILFLGDRGFLKHYGSPYSAQQVEGIARRVLTSSGLGLASGDWPTARAVSNALAGGPRARHTYHSRFLIRVTEQATGQGISVRQVQANPTWLLSVRRSHPSARSSTTLGTTGSLRLCNITGCRNG